MNRVFFLVLVPLLCVYSQSVRQKSHTTTYEVTVPANELTKITMYNADSTHSFILFENIIEKKQKLIFIIQPTYFSQRTRYKNEIVLPFPKVKSGAYFIKFSNRDTTYNKEMIFLK